MLGIIRKIVCVHQVKDLENKYLTKIEWKNILHEISGIFPNYREKVEKIWKNRKNPGFVWKYHKNLHKSRFSCFFRCFVYGLSQFLRRSFQRIFLGIFSEYVFSFIQIVRQEQSKNSVFNFHHLFKSDISTDSFPKIDVYRLQCLMFSMQSIFSGIFLQCFCPNRNSRIRIPDTTCIHMWSNQFPIPCCPNRH